MIHHKPTYSWSVKGESASVENTSTKKISKKEKANLLVKENGLASIKKDIIKSIIIVICILFLELVLYLAWKKLVP